MNSMHTISDVESSLPVDMTLPDRRRARYVARKWMPLRAWAMLAGMALCLALAVTGSATASVPTAHVSTCAEDASCWTWSRMGNQARGVVLKRSAPRVGERIAGKGRAWRRVTPCTFREASRRGFIDWQRTPRLRGDAWARRHGCSREGMRHG